FDPNWKVFVDGKQQPLLLCNFIMRGVQVPTGTHQVEFRFEPPVRALYVSLVGMVIGLVLIGCLLFIKEPQPAPAPGPDQTCSGPGQGKGLTANRRESTRIQE